MIHNNYFSVADDDCKWFYDSLKKYKNEKNPKAIAAIY